MEGVESLAAAPSLQAGGAVIKVALCIGAGAQRLAWPPASPADEQAADCHQQLQKMQDGAVQSRWLTDKHVVERWPLGASQESHPPAGPLLRGLGRWSRGACGHSVRPAWLHLRLEIALSIRTSGCLHVHVEAGSCPSCRKLALLQYLLQTGSQRLATLACCLQALFCPALFSWACKRVEGRLLSGSCAHGRQLVCGPNGLAQALAKEAKARDAPVLLGRLTAP